MTLPTFLVIGAMKNATTSLCDILSRHPQVFISELNEPEFFCRQEMFAKGISAYKAYFSSAGRAIAVGEGSTSYTKMGIFPGVAERIANSLPGVLLIYILRDLVHRIESHWLHTLRTGHRPPESFAKSIAIPGNNYVDTSL